MTVRWDNQYYESANSFMTQAGVLQKAGDHRRSWQLSFSARLAYLCDAIVNIVIIPLALCSLIFNGLYSLCAWDFSRFKATKEFLLEKSNHFFLSTCGSFLSPALAHKYRDANLAPYIIALRIVAVATLYLVYHYSNT